MSNLKSKQIVKERNVLDKTLYILHPALELLDPNPDIETLFSRFNERFFNGDLSSVKLKWDKRMTSSAGMSYLYFVGNEKLIAINLSEPLLKFRSRKDLIETLLHEMIHAYCFKHDIREPCDGHGIHFHQMMRNINEAAGTNITVYHSFHREINFYRKQDKPVKTAKFYEKKVNGPSVNDKPEQNSKGNRKNGSKTDAVRKGQNQANNGDGVSTTASESQSLVEWVNETNKEINCCMCNTNMKLSVLGSHFEKCTGIFGKSVV